jgi:hypothetical protein
MSAGINVEARVREERGFAKHRRGVQNAGCTRTPESFGLIRSREPNVIRAGLLPWHPHLAGEKKGEEEAWEDLELKVARREAIARVSPNRNSRRARRQSRALSCQASRR